MKNIFAIIISLLIGYPVFGQNTPISFVNNERAKDTIGDFVLDWDERISEITLTSKTEFEFRSFPSRSSCLTWREYYGTWERKNDTLVFSDQYELIENDTRLKFVNKPSNNYYTLNFKTDKSSDLRNKEIVIELVYDYDSGLKSKKLDLELNDENFLIIPFNKIPDRNQLASFCYEYLLTDGDKRYGYITKSNTVNVKENELPNFAEITIIEVPKKEIVYRTTKAIVKADKLKIVSTEKTTSNLTDYNQNLAFKEDYAIENNK
ncbi:conserved hypothetical protein [Tenacibaculum litopenaei]|uniref:hypothetical protein n=1 Tax=Tenacibaculum litopenaei TaxID=396016 RepID=UPI003894D638